MARRHAPADALTGLEGINTLGTVVVTGGAGFIGGHIVDNLLAHGSPVLVLDDLSNSSDEGPRRWSDVAPGRFAFVHGSVLSPGTLAAAQSQIRALASADDRVTVLHLAAMGSVVRSMEQPALAWDINASGTQRVLDLARACSARRVVLASSSSVYGESRTLPKRESMQPKPMSPYAASKLAAEELCRTYSRAFGMSTVCLRYFNVFGPRQRADSPYAAVVARFALSLLQGQSPVIFGDGLQSRDFTYVDNVVRATVQAALSDRPWSGEPVNIALGEAMTVLDVARVLARCAKQSRVPMTMLPARAGEVRHSLADITRARARLDFEPIVSSERGLERTFESARAAWGGTA